MRILAVDPGTAESAWMLYDSSARRILEMGIPPNRLVVNRIEAADAEVRLVVEMIACYGMPVGRETFETCLWIGEFRHARRPMSTRLMYRRDIKLHLCNSSRAKDANVRQALIDRFGGSRRAAIGVKKAPGPLYGVKTHLWAALAVAVAYAEQAETESDAGRVDLVA